MTAAVDASPRSRTDHAARLLTEIFAPAVWAAAMPVVIALHAAGWRAGTGWGALALLFSAAIPYGAVRIGVRLGRLTDHHLGRREQRRIPLLIGVASVALGLLALRLLGAPAELLAMVVIMFVVLLGTGLVNLGWKLSGHTAISAGSFAVLVLIFGPGWLAGATLVAAVGWSRVHLRDHTVAQVTAGALLGAALATITFTLTR